MLASARRVHLLTRDMAWEQTVGWGKKGGGGGRGGVFSTAKRSGSQGLTVNNLGWCPSLLDFLVHGIFFSSNQ